MSEHLTLRKPYLVLLCIVCLGWVYFFFRSELFELRDVEVQASGGALIANDVLPIVLNVLDQRSVRPWSKRHVFFLPDQLIEEGIQTALYAERVEVGGTDNNILRLKILFGSRYLYVTQNGEAFLMSSVARPAGVSVMDPATLTSAKRHFHATDFTTHKLDGIVYVRKATSTLSVPRIKRVLELGKSLEDHQLAYAHLQEQMDQSLTIQIDRTCEALIDLEQPLDDQVERIQSILRDKEYKTRRPLQIDVRIPGRAYIR